MPLEPADEALQPASTAWDEHKLPAGYHKPPPSRPPRPWTDSLQRGYTVLALHTVELAYLLLMLFGADYAHAEDTSGLGRSLFVGLALWFWAAILQCLPRYRRMPPPGKLVLLNCLGSLLNLALFVGVAYYSVDQIFGHWTFGGVH